MSPNPTCIACNIGKLMFTSAVGQDSAHEYAWGVGGEDCILWSPCTVLTSKIQPCSTWKCWFLDIMTCVMFTVQLSPKYLCSVILQILCSKTLRAQWRFLSDKYAQNFNLSQTRTLVMMKFNEHLPTIQRIYLLGISEFLTDHITQNIAAISGLII